MFLTYPVKHNNCKSKSAIMNDIMNHGTHPTWKNYLDGDNLITGAHEGIHFINSELRMIRDGQSNKVFENIEEELDISLGSKGFFTTDQQTTITDEFGNFLWQPVEGFYATGDRSNCFYVGKDRYIRLREPNIRKSNVAQFVPSNLRSFRFSTYITGQTAWDDTPLYIYDEWVAYCAGTETALDLNSLGFSDGKGTDQPHGPLEFSVYAIALCMAVKKLDPKYLTTETDFKKFTLWNLIRAFNLYFDAMEKFPWPDSNRLFGNLKRDTNYNNFLKEEFSFVIPDGKISDKEIDEKLFNIYR